MACLHLLSVVSASLLLFAEANPRRANELFERTTYDVALGQDGACLSEIDAAREAAGLRPFTRADSADEAFRLPNPKDINRWKHVCGSLISPDEAGETGRSQSKHLKFNSGTYAFMVLPSASPDCSATVDQWKAAYKNFDGPPPANCSTPAYDNQDNISFLALYNPSTSATADCRVVTCVELHNQPIVNFNTQTIENNLEPTGNQGHALICMTTPDVLEAHRTQPFTQEQWDKIVGSLGSSASPPFLSLVTVVVAALSFLIG